LLIRVLPDLATLAKRNHVLDGVIRFEQECSERSFQHVEITKLKEACMPVLRTRVRWWFDRWMDQITSALT
jgi:hypothetical protein